MASEAEGNHLAWSRSAISIASTTSENTPISTPGSSPTNSTFSHLIPSDGPWRTPSSFYQLQNHSSARAITSPLTPSRSQRLRPEDNSSAASHGSTRERVFLHIIGMLVIFLMIWLKWIEGEEFNPENGMARNSIFREIRNSLNTKVAYPTVPRAGHTYMIRDVARGRIITLTKGEIHALSNPKSGDWKWVCVEKNSLFGFYNSISGRYIGHDDKNNFIAEAKSHRDWESFRLMPHPKGGYFLAVQFFWWHTLKMVVNEGTEGANLIVKYEDQVGEWTTWEFVEV